jgi:translocation and assembly module TamB
LVADVRILNALLVTADQRIPLDTVQLACRQDTEWRTVHPFKQPDCNALLEGQFQLTELGTVFQQTINPYYTIATAPLPAVKPYDFRFTIDVATRRLLHLLYQAL